MSTRYNILKSICSSNKIENAALHEQKICMYYFITCTIIPFMLVLYFCSERVAVEYFTTLNIVFFTSIQNSLKQFYESSAER